MCHVVQVKRQKIGPRRHPSLFVPAGHFCSIQEQVSLFYCSLRFGPVSQKRDNFRHGDEYRTNQLKGSNTPSTLFICLCQLEGDDIRWSLQILWWNNSLCTQAIIFLFFCVCTLTPAPANISSVNIIKEVQVRPIFR